MALAALPAAAADIEVNARTIEQAAVFGRLVQFSLRGELVLDPGEGSSPLSIASAELMHIQALNTEPVQTGPYSLLLQGGDRLYGTVAGSTPDHVQFNTILRDAVSIPLESMRAFLTPQASTPSWRDRVDRLIAASDLQDQALLINGDVLTGFASDIGRDQVVFERGGNEITISMERIIAVVLASPEAEPPAGGRAQLELADGSLITVSELRWSPDNLDLTFFDGTFQGLPAASVRRIEVRSDKWRWLDELTPAASVHTPMLSLSWPHRVNRNVLGGPLRMAGQNFTHGLGVHARTVLRYDLGGAYHTFSTRCGLDESAGAHADLDAAVLVDGQVRWEQKHMQAASPPQDVRIDISGAASLELRVDYGHLGAIQDRFNWADAILTR